MPSNEPRRNPQPSPERFDATCGGCGQKVISTNGRCPNGCYQKAVRTSPDEVIKKVVDDNDLQKGF